MTATTLERRKTMNAGIHHSQYRVFRIGAGMWRANCQSCSHFCVRSGPSINAEQAVIAHLSDEHGITIEEPT